MAKRKKISSETLASRIFIVRGHKVMIDSDLALIYQVETRVLNQAVKRNIRRFPEDFMFRLTRTEFEILRSQFVMSSEGGKNNSSQTVMSSGKHRGTSYLPLAFTEHGALMLASVLKSKVAVDASISVVRAFIKLREILASHQELAKKLSMLEGKLGQHDQEIKALFSAIRQLMQPAPQPRKKIGYRQKEEE